MTSLDAIHFSAISYAHVFLDGATPLSEVLNIDKQAEEICDGLGIPMGKVPHPRFGQVNTYPKSVLDEICH